MKLCEFDYDLPKDLIAQFPLEKRDASRLLVLDRTNQNIFHRNFYDVADYFSKGDTLVLNNTKVILARLFGNRKETGGKVEVLLQEKVGKKQFRALIKPLARLKPGEEVAINNNGINFKVVDFKKRIIEFNKQGILNRLNAIGHVPLPQYIKRSDSLSDRKTYQTVYAKKQGSIAAPTAGLHFTRDLLRKIRKKGVNIAFVTLHVGYGTFASIKEDDISRHKMEEEYFQIPKETVSLIKDTKRKSKKVFAVGTTTTRALESSQDKILSRAAPKDTQGRTDLFIHPPFKFNVVDSLITNFHLPKSTLYLLVSAFAGLDNIKKVYQEAIENRYRFFSYGDATLIL
ncbi:MAG: tRNA preQ1(34) S-adenosylmethionine ribosyltransferase-isomerase QueA [Candidatus Omnitrophica bacterium]|nr:tRNA preQ1(34) S-adenosylmethionine ribosyltransferase-isomerase QueA [Candidatus Omnitrophota bacterium]MDD5351876.1 tRNA preQ1(34) S-adenosylmethionine ribosyltransferase-isomerase QueA [Candidatus Omnitrophota bacterium]MDD5550702.1 tRNA preQ1(34) S-adenosylmethionine ribosyltransferase-isomerase QueA [Candidatus Omnitrophota bacterium]